MSTDTYLEHEGNGVIGTQIKGKITQMNADFIRENSLTPQKIMAVFLRKNAHAFLWKNNSVRRGLV